MREEEEEEDGGQMVMGREKDGEKMDGGGREAFGCHVQPAAAGAHSNNMEITAGRSNRTSIESHSAYHQSIHLFFLICCNCKLSNSGFFIWGRKKKGFYC